MLRIVSQAFFWRFYILSEKNLAYPLVESTNYTDYWRELTDTICNLVLLTRPITTKHENQRFKKGKQDWTIKDQIKKVQEECLEIIEADAQNDQKHFAEENLDLLFATITQLHKSHLTGTEIKFAVETCLAKFQKRNWLF